MQCGLLKLSRVLRDRVRGESHAAPEPNGRTRSRCDRGAYGRPAGERPASGATGEREFTGWTVSVDNFS